MKKKQPPCIWPGCPAESEYTIEENQSYCHGHLDAYNLSIKLKNVLAELKWVREELRTCKESR